MEGWTGGDGHEECLWGEEEEGALLWEASTYNKDANSSFDRVVQG